MEKFVKKQPIIRKSICELLTSASVSPEDISKYVPFEKIQNNLDYCFSNRKDYLMDIFDSLNSKEQNLVLISGFQGTGKSTLIRAINTSLEENILCFSYEFSIITKLDDIILSLYRYLNKYFIKDPEYSRTDKMTGNQSIDERLINYLKILKRPLLITFDGFENIFKNKSDSIDAELCNFINYLLSVQFVKLVISGRKLPLSLKTDPSKTLSVRLGGLDEIDAIKILDNSNINCSESTVYQLLDESRGYPESIILFINAVKITGLDAFDLMKEYVSSDDSFEDYIIKKIYNNIPEASKPLAWNLATIRHYIDLSVIDKLNLVENSQETVDYLQKCNILNSGMNGYYIKKSLKEYIYKTIPYSEKIKIHKYWHELYAGQISKKLEERFFSLSRKLLHSEQYYHYICLTKLDKNFNAGNNNKIKYMTDSHLVSLLGMNKPASESSPVTSIDETLPEDLQTESHYSDIYTDSDLTVELTDEEKLLLNSEENKGIDNNTEEPDKTLYQEPEPEKIEDMREYYLNTANIHITDDKADFIINNLKKAYEISNNLNDNASLANISALIANVLKETNKLNDAVDYYNRAYKIFTDLNDDLNAVQVVLNLANIYSECFKHDTALQYFHKIIDNANSNIPEKTYIEALIGIGEIYDYREELDLALKFYKEAYEKTAKISDLEIKSTVCFKLALAYDDMKNIDEALNYYKKSIEICSDFEVNPNLSSSYANIATIYEDIDDKNLAKEYYLKSLEVDIRMNSWEDQYKTLSRLGNIYFETGDIKRAFDSFRRELAVAKIINDPYFIAMSFLDIGDLYFYIKNYKNAVKAFILSRKTIGNTISTDSKEKIERRFRHIISEISEEKFNEILKSLTRKQSVQSNNEK